MIVLDASAALALVSPSQATQAATQFFSQNTHFTAPAIFPYEVRNALLRLERRMGLHVLDVDSQLQELNLLIGAVEAPLDPAGLMRVAALARPHKLGFFDACYLDLALRERAALASRDGPLLEAAQRRGVTVHDLR